MAIPVSILMIALGWVLVFTVAGALGGVSINVVGIALVVAGAGLLLFWLTRAVT